MTFEFDLSSAIVGALFGFAATLGAAFLGLLGTIVKAIPEYRKTFRSDPEALQHKVTVAQENERSAVHQRDAWALAYDGLSRDLENTELTSAELRNVAREALHLLKILMNGAELSLRSMVACITHTFHAFESEAARMRSAKTPGDLKRALNDVVVLLHYLATTCSSLALFASPGSETDETYEDVCASSELLPLLNDPQVKRYVTLELVRDPSHEHIDAHVAKLEQESLTLRDIKIAMGYAPNTAHQPGE